MAKLTPSQQAAKERVEAEGKKFISPSRYKKMKPVKTVSSKAVRKAYTKPLYQDISPVTESILKQCLDPESIMSIERWPNTYGLSAVYKCKNVLNAKFSADNKCAVVVHPRLRNSIFMTNGSVVTGSLPSSTGSDPMPFSQKNIMVDTEVSHTVHWGEPIFFPDNNVLLPTPVSALNKLLYPCTFNVISGTPTLYFEFAFSLAHNAQLGTRVEFYDSSYSLVHTETNYTNSNGIATATILSSGLPSGSSSYFAISIIDANTPFSGTCNLNIYDSSLSGWEYELPDHAQHMSSYDLRDASTLLANSNRSFILSQSLLCTSEMSDINNGGMIATARLPSQTIIGEGNMSNTDSWYEYLSSLSYNNYDGPVKDGSYSWYLPEDETGFFYKDVDSYFNFNDPYLAAEFNVADTTEQNIVRIKVCTVVQFTTNSSIYSLAPSEYMDNVRKLHYLLSCVNAAYSNDGHIEGLRKHLSSIGNGLLKLLKNPKTYQKASDLALALAPIGALLL